jgi:hypothetical protein
MENDKTYYELKLWENRDSLITTNNIRISINSYKDNYGLSFLSLGVFVSNYKSRLNMNYNMDHQKINIYLTKFKSIFNGTDKLRQDLTNTKTTKSFIVQDFRKLVTTFVYRVEYNDVCVKISIGESNRDLIDSESSFMNLDDYISFVKVLENFRERFLETSILFSNNILLTDLNNKINTFDNMYNMNEKINHTNDSVSVNSIDKQFKNNNSSSSSSENEKLNNELTDFLDKNTNTMDIGLKTTEKQYVPVIEKISDDIFTDKILNNNVLKLETELINCLNTPLPLQKFIDRIEKESGKSLKLNGEMSAIQFLTTCFIKFYVNNHLEEKQKLPSKTIPIFFKANKKEPINISLMYDLFVYFCYYSILSSSLSEKDYNTLNNRSLYAFILKSLSAPLIFSFFHSIEKEIIISTTLNKYTEYYKKGVFKELEDKIYVLYKFKPEINSESMKIEIIKNLESIIKIQDKYSIQLVYNNILSKKIISLPFNLFIDSSFTQEQIIKLTVLDFYFTKKNKIDLQQIEKCQNIKDFTDMSDKILNFFNVSCKADCTNLIRYVTQTFKDHKDLPYFLEICKAVNKNYRDLKNKNIEFVNLPEQLLKALYLWDIDQDEKIKTNFIYYNSLINNSTLNHSMLVSMFNKIDERITCNFIETINSLNEIGV